MYSATAWTDVKGDVNCGVSAYQPSTTGSLNSDHRWVSLLWVWSTTWCMRNHDNVIKDLQLSNSSWWCMVSSSTSQFSPFFVSPMCSIIYPHWIYQIVVVQPDVFTTVVRCFWFPQIRDWLLIGASAMGFLGIHKPLPVARSIDLWPNQWRHRGGLGQLPCFGGEWNLWDVLVNGSFNTMDCSSTSVGFIPRSFRMVRPKQKNHWILMR